MKSNTKAKQQGFVSIFTVLFFMVLITVITVGFLRIIVRDQGQSADNSLSGSALYAAKAGIEDGKRALLADATTTDPVLKSALDSVLNNPNAGCKDLFGNLTIANALGLDPTGKVAGGSGLNQNYSCLIVSPISPDYLGNSAASTSTIVPLKGAGTYTSIQVMWHDNIQDGTVGSPIATPISGFPTQSAWDTAKGNNKTAEYLRLELIKTPLNGAITPNSITSKVVYLIPAGIGSVADFNLPQPNSARALCKTIAASQYACSTSLAVAGDGTSQLYLRVTPLYGSVHFAVCLQSCGTPVNFNGAQPIVDATGQASNVFRRVQARISITAQVPLPEYSLESGHSVCKAFSITDKINTANGDGAGCSVP